MTTPTYPHRIEPSRLIRAMELPIAHCPERGPRVYRVASGSGRKPWEVNLDLVSPAQPCICEDYGWNGHKFDCKHVLKARLVERDPMVILAAQVIKLHEVVVQRERERRQRRKTA